MINLKTWPFKALDFKMDQHVPLGRSDLAMVWLLHYRRRKPTQPSKTPPDSPLRRF
jgi:hypothetical protein